MPAYENAVVLCGPDLTPFRCKRFTTEGDTIRAIDRTEPVLTLDAGARVIIPGLYNSHTHMGDSCLPDGATGMTLEEGFFRPDGYKYRELARQDRASHIGHIVNHLRTMAASGTVCHIDFREQGVEGASRLREASRQTRVQSVILSQFNQLPFTQEELETNSALLPPEAEQELAALLEAADGFSESTMNDLTSPAWRQIRDVTREAGKLRAIHCLENAGYRDVSLKRTARGDLDRAIELLDPHLIIHLTVANDREIALLATEKKTAVLNPRANANLALPFPPIPGLLDAGVNCLLGTDNGLLNSPNLFAEMDYTYKLTKALSGDVRRPDPTDILRMATSNIRPALGGDHYGYLEPGLPASYVVLDFTAPHLRATRHLSASIVTRVTPADVRETWHRGQKLYPKS
ncbi:MAG: amidohydrolase family protein [Opitutales bacterium]